MTVTIPLPSPDSDVMDEKELSLSSAGTLKRKRSLPLTPPSTIEDPEVQLTLSRAVDVLSTEATALSHITRHYQTDPTAREGLLRAVECVASVNESGGKVIVCGVGKSGLIGMKAVATMKSLGIATSFMHAAEAVHGDLGDVRMNDAVLFVSFSGRTSELLNLLPHISPSIPILAITSHTTASSCPLLAGRSRAILLPAPIHESEVVSFGISAPTTSTTVALAVTDMLALATADKMHRSSARIRQVFHANHPGGAIGQAAGTPTTPRLLADVAVPVNQIPLATSRSAIDVLRAAASSRTGWVKTDDTHVLRPRDVQHVRSDGDVPKLERSLPATYWHAPAGVTITQAVKLAKLGSPMRSEAVFGVIAAGDGLAAVIDRESFCD